MLLQPHTRAHSGSNPIHRGVSLPTKRHCRTQCSSSATSLLDPPRPAGQPTVPAEGTAPPPAPVAVPVPGAAPGADVDTAPATAETAAPDVQYQQWELVSREQLAGGVLDTISWDGPRMLRVWAPPGYSYGEGGRSGHPVLYLNDGQNLFKDADSFSGCSWRVAETCSGLIRAGVLPPFVVVGMDHAGPQRSFDYCPCKPGTGPGGFRADAAAWPGGGVQAYLQRVLTEVVPFVCERYNTSREPRHSAFGGSSFGGVCALCMGMAHPGAFGALLVESPSLWIGDESFLRQDIASYQGPWPRRVFVGMGTQEFSGIRAKAQLPSDAAKWDVLVASYAPALGEALEEQGLREGERLVVEVAEGATHNEAAWAQRLPGALTWLLSGWWDPWAQRYADSLYWSSPRRLKAGQPALLVFNRQRSATLASSGPAGSPPSLTYGFNNWAGGSARAAMCKASHLPAPFGGDVWTAQIQVPSDAHEMNLAFSTADGNAWDNHDGDDFYAPVKTADQQLREAAIRMGVAGAGSAFEEGAPEGASSQQQAASAARAAVLSELSMPADEVAAHNQRNLYFTVPKALVAGAPAVLYLNRKRSWALANSPNIKLHYGFNDWQAGASSGDLRPTSLWRCEEVDWWAAQLDVPQDAADMNFAFTDGHGVWDSNDGHNYMAPVQQPGSGGRGAAGLAAASTVNRRTIESVESSPHGTGTMHVITLSKRGGGNKRARWSEERRLRVWTPPGFDSTPAPAGGWPVLYFNDGQNLFEDWLAHQGVSWRLGYTASDLIQSGQLPPFVVVGIDSVGPMRSLNYLPFPPGTGAGGFRGDCERWPGGGVQAYMHRVVHELMPLVVERFGVSTDPCRVALGGGSFAGVACLYAAMHYPHVFGSVLAESPSLWVGEGRFLGDMGTHGGRLPERVWVGCGTREYSATRDHDREDVDQLLLHYYCEAARILREKGLRGSRLALQVEPEAGHHEGAWQWRMTGALRYLLGPWWEFV